MGVICAYIITYLLIILFLYYDGVHIKSLIQAAAISRPLSGSFKIKFPKSAGVLTVQFQVTDACSGTYYFKVTGDSEHITSIYHDMIADIGTMIMSGIVILNDRILKK